MTSAWRQRTLAAPGCHRARRPHMPTAVGRARNKVIKPAPEMKAVTGVHCANGAKGTEFHAVIQNDIVIILKMATTAGTTADPMAREEATRYMMPPGAMVEGGT